MVVIMADGLLFGIPFEEAMIHFHEKHEAREFISPDEAEQYVIGVSDEHPDKFDREVFGFGPKCPTPLKERAKRVQGVPQ